MHLLAAEAGRIDDGDAAVDLDQLPGDIVFLSSADSELSALGQAASQSSLDISLRLANLGMLSHPLSVDLYIEKTLSRSKLIVVRMMGGEGYWPYGLDRLREAARNGGPILVVVPGEDRWDLGLEPFTTSELESARGLWRYLVEGGAVNSARAFQSMAHLLGRAKQPPPPEVLPRAGCYLPGDGPVDLARMMESIDPNLPSAAIVFYRAYVQSAMTAPIDALAEELAKVGINAVADLCGELEGSGFGSPLERRLCRAPACHRLEHDRFCSLDHRYRAWRYGSGSSRPACAASSFGRNQRRKLA